MLLAVDGRNTIHRPKVGRSSVGVDGRTLVLTCTIIFELARMDINVGAVKETGSLMPSQAVLHTKAAAQCWGDIVNLSLLLLSPQTALVHSHSQSSDVKPPPPAVQHRSIV